MGGIIRFRINGIEVTAGSEDTILTAALKAGIYIPHLCSHPDLPVTKIKSKQFIFRGNEKYTGLEGKQFAGCQLCLVETTRNGEIVRACITRPEANMLVDTETPGLRELRRNNLTKLLTNHPHACLTCPQSEGCSLSHCSSNISEAERCCSKFFKCELRKLVGYIGIKDDISRYIPHRLPVITEEPLFFRDYNLCIDCLRCVRTCHDLVGKGALGFTVKNAKPIVGTNAPTLKESGCKFCGACVEICPTGALTDKPLGKPLKRTHGLQISPTIFPPNKWLELEHGIIETVPEQEGVYQLADKQKNIIYIGGTLNLRRELREHLKNATKARFFTFELERMYTRRESELLQEFLQVHGRLPEQNVAIDDLLGA